MNDELLSAIARYRSAEAALNGAEAVENSPEELELHASVDAINSLQAPKTTVAGALEALLLGTKELEDFDSGGMVKALVTAATSHFVKVASKSPTAFNNALTMVDAFPAVECFQGAEFAAVFDALTACREILSGVMAQPRCGSHSPNPAGDYLGAIFDFMTFERRRIMRHAMAVLVEDRSDEEHERLRSIISFLAEDADFTFDAKVGLIAVMANLERADD